MSKFEIYVDGKFEADLNVEEKNWIDNGDNVVYKFLNLSFLSIDFENSDVQIKSSTNLNFNVLLFALRHQKKFPLQKWK